DRVRRRRAGARDRRRRRLRRRDGRLARARPRPARARPVAARLPGSGCEDAAVRKVNILSPAFEGAWERDGYRRRAAWLGKQLGAEKIGASLYELPEGEKTFPYHFHYGMEEWLIVVSGTPTLRDPERERELRRGDVVCFPPGPEGGHQLRGPGTVMVISAQ